MQAITGWGAMERRLARLAFVSLIALGFIWALARESGYASSAAEVSLAAGWLSMPISLVAGVFASRLRILLLLPSTLVTLGLLAVARQALLDSATDATGWLLLLSGIILGDILGAWLWFGWAHVPRNLRDPEAPLRWTLIVVHVLLIAAGVAVIVT